MYVGADGSKVLGILLQTGIAMGMKSQSTWGSEDFYRIKISECEEATPYKPMADDERLWSPASDHNLSQAIRVTNDQISTCT